MSILIAGGDSFTYGNELQDGNQRPSLSTYPALIAKELDMEYVCAAQPGFANSSIRRTVMDACENYADIRIVLVQWTFLGRYEFHFQHGWDQISAWSVIDDTTEIEKTFKINNPIVLQHHADNLAKSKQLGITDFAREFYNKVGGNFYWEQYHLLSEMLLLQQYLELRSIPYMFTAADETLFRNTSVFKDESLTTLEQQIDKKYWAWFPQDRGFYTWAQHEQFPFGTTHPLEEAHIEAAHIVYEHLRNIGRLP